MEKKKTIAKVVVAVVLWAIAIVRIIAYGRNDTKETIVSAFDKIRLTQMNANLEGFGFYADVYLSDQAKEVFVKDIGYDLGLNYCDITQSRNGELAVTTLLKEGKYATTTIQMITKEEKLTENMIESKQYICIDVELGENLEAAIYYQEKISEEFQKLGIEGTVTINLSGYLDGRADLVMRNLIADQILKQMDAKIMAQNRSEELYTIYAYTKRVNDYIVVSGEKINLNISTSYDEEENRTYFYVSTPIITSDY